MKVTTQIEDYSNPAKSPIRIHNCWNDGDRVEVEVDGERHIVDGDELISAVKRCMLNCFGR